MEMENNASKINLLKKKIHDSQLVKTFKTFLAFLREKASTSLSPFKKYFCLISGGNLHAGLLHNFDNGNALIVELLLL